MASEPAEESVPTQSNDSPSTEQVDESPVSRPSDDLSERPSTASEKASNADESPAKAKQDLSGKVRIHFQAVGNAPIMKKNKFVVRDEQPFAKILDFLRSKLKLEESDALFVYCNSAFCPTPDQQVKDLFQCFQKANELQLNYSIQEAWG